MAAQNLAIKLGKNLIGADVMNDMGGNIIYLRLFGTLPNSIDLDNLSDIGKEKYLLKIAALPGFQHLIKSEDYEGPKKKIHLGYWYLTHPTKKIVIAKTSNYGGVVIYYPYNQSAKDIQKYLDLTKGLEAKPKKPKRRGRVYMLGIKGTGMKATEAFIPFKLDSFKFSLEDNYAPDFHDPAAHIIHSLNRKDGKGVVILHGDPGTGKSFFLRHLCKVLKKKILYIPPAMVQYITNPYFMQLLQRHKNSVLIIEDGDNVVKKRDEHSDTQTVSSILNLTDGMLQDVLKLQVVITFNTDIDKTDPALRRVGRLIAEHKLKNLPKDHAQKLSDKLGFKTKITKEMSLAEVYNQNDPNYKENQDRPRIGFNQ